MPRTAWGAAASSALIAFASAVPVSAQTPASARADPARTPDAAFVAKAAGAVAVDHDLATLAVRRAGSTKVRALARRVLDSRAAIAADLQAMAGDRQLSGPDSPAEAAPASPAPASPIAALRDSPPAGFDAAFLAALLANGEAAVALFEGESRDGRDDEIKDWAARQLPALRDHVAAVRAMRPRQGS